MLHYLLLFSQLNENLNLQIWTCKKYHLWGHYLLFKSIIHRVPVLTVGVSWSSNALITNTNFFIKNRWKLNTSVSTSLSSFPACAETCSQWESPWPDSSVLADGHCYLVLLTCQLALSSLAADASHWVRVTSACQWLWLLVSAFQGNFSSPWTSVCLTTVQSQLPTLHHGSISSRKQGKRKSIKHENI